MVGTVYEKLQSFKKNYDIQSFIKVLILYTYSPILLSTQPYLHVYLSIVTYVNAYTSISTTLVTGLQIVSLQSLCGFTLMSHLYDWGFVREGKESIMPKTLLP